MLKKENIYRYYQLRKPLLVNEKMIKQIIISSHYEISHSYLTDEIILELVQQLDGKIFQAEDAKTNPKREFFSQDGLEYQEYRYKLVWLLWEKSNDLGVITCYRRRKTNSIKNHEKKKY